MFLAKFLFVSIFANFVFCWSPQIHSIFSAKRSAYGIFENDRLVESLAAGAQLALQHCQDKFKWDTWNCPEISFSRRGRQPANKETAFVRAITSAGVMYNVARNCSRGDLESCKCSKSVTKDNAVDVNTALKQLHLRDKNMILQTVANAKIKVLKDDHAIDSIDDADLNMADSAWQWAGCAIEHAVYGEQVAKEFLDSLDKGTDLQAHMHLHNSEVGRLAVVATMRKQCRCHGVSGSCSMQTCWTQLAPFSEVASLLRQSYDSAVQIDFADSSSTTGNHIGVGNSARAGSVPEDVFYERLRDSTDLVYIEESPDYCVANNTTGWPGTLGRVCSKDRSDRASVQERRSCGRVCRSCGHRVRRRKRTTTRRCGCVFKWCCNVTCDSCTETVDEHFCE